jgi:hypothetical protein
MVQAAVIDWCACGGGGGFGALLLGEDFDLGHLEVLAASEEALALPRRVR